MVSFLRDWSKGSGKYNAKDFDKVVRSYDSSRIERVGLTRLEEISKKHRRTRVELPFHADAVELSTLAMDLAGNRSSASWCNTGWNGCSTASAARSIATASC